VAAVGWEEEAGGGGGGGGGAYLSYLELHITQTYGSASSLLDEARP
jgi:hypothetical protein